MIRFAFPEPVVRNISLGAQVPLRAFNHVNFPPVSGRFIAASRLPVAVSPSGSVR
jgi:hypothetical protein